MACSGDRKKSIWLGHTEMEKEGWGSVKARAKAGTVWTERMEWT